MMDRLYLEERKALLTTEHDITKSLDKWVLTLSGGALALSVTFLGELVTPGQIKSPALLYAGWFLLMVGVGCPLVSMYLRAYEKYRDIMDREHAQSGTDMWAPVREAQGRVAESKAIEPLALAGLLGFLVGMFLLGHFAYVNLR